MSNHKLDLTNMSVITTLQQAVGEKASALYSEYWELNGTEGFTAVKRYDLLIQRAENLLASAQLDVAYWAQSHREWLALEDSDSPVDRATAAVRRAEIAKYKAICEEKAEYLAEQRELYRDAMRQERVQRNS